MKSAPLPTLINSFRGEWGFLSNFYPAAVKLWIGVNGEIYSHEIPDGIVENYASVEHAYQAAKFLESDIRQRFRWDITSSQAKFMARGLKKKVRADWVDINLGYMRELLLQKFTPSLTRRKLLATFNAELIEGNYWHDDFYGICYGEFEGRTCREWPHEPTGRNLLGKMIMDIRDALAAGG